MSDLKITNLHKHYGAFHAVKGINLEVPSGEFTVLVGPSGCGKSTLLRTIAGLEEASEGSVEIGGRDVTYARPRDRDIAMVFQNYALYPYLNVKDNIAFGLRARKFAEPEVEKRVARAAEMLGIGSEDEPQRWNATERALLDEKIAAREPFLYFIYSRQNADGSMQYLQVSGEPMFDHGSRFVGYRGIGLDITARQQKS